MSISKRNSNLFAAENWEVAYSAYTNVSFKAYDFSTMRSAMLNYIRENYPENFNDYIEVQSLSQLLNCYLIYLKV